MPAKVSVIIPIYNVSQFITRCAESLLTQTLEDVELIFVDDASPDNSIALLEDVIAKHPDTKKSVQIIRHEKNKGLPSARNSGLKVATGEYIFHCDGDDFVDTNMLEELYSNAISNNADIVWCDWYLTMANSERYMSQPTFPNAESAIKAMLGGAMKYNVWNKLVRRNLYIDNCITFPDGYGMGEDMTMIMLFAHAKNVSHIAKAYYHYVKTNTSAFSQTYSERHLNELRYNVDRLELFITSKYGDSMNQELAFMKLEAKFPFLMTNDKRKFKLWKEWYPEANKYILKNYNTSFRRRIIQYLAHKDCWPLVALYNWLFNKIIYGIIYK